MLGLIASAMLFGYFMQVEIECDEMAPSASERCTKTDEPSPVDTIGGLNDESSQRAEECNVSGFSFKLESKFLSL